MSQLGPDLWLAGVSPGSVIVADYRAHCALAFGGRKGGADRWGATGAGLALSCMGAPKRQAAGRGDARAGCITPMETWVSLKLFQGENHPTRLGSTATRREAVLPIDQLSVASLVQAAFGPDHERHLPHRGRAGCSGSKCYRWAVVPMGGRRMPPGTKWPMSGMGIFLSVSVVAAGRRHKRDILARSGRHRLRRRLGSRHSSPEHHGPAPTVLAAG